MICMEGSLSNQLGVPDASGGAVDRKALLQAAVKSEGE